MLAAKKVLDRPPVSGKLRHIIDLGKFEEPLYSAH